MVNSCLVIYLYTSFATAQQHTHADIVTPLLFQPTTMACSLLAGANRSAFFCTHFTGLPDPLQGAGRCVHGNPVRLRMLVLSDQQLRLGPPRTRRVRHPLHGRRGKSYSTPAGCCSCCARQNLVTTFLASLRYEQRDRSRNSAFLYMFTFLIGTPLPKTNLSCTHWSILQTSSWPTDNVTNEGACFQ